MGEGRTPRDDEALLMRWVMVEPTKAWPYLGVITIQRGGDRPWIFSILISLN